MNEPIMPGDCAQWVYPHCDGQARHPQFGSFGTVERIYVPHPLCYMACCVCDQHADGEFVIWAGIPVMTSQLRKLPPLSDGESLDAIMEAPVLPEMVPA